MEYNASGPDPAELIAGGIGLLIFLVLMLAIVVLTILIRWKIFSKAGVRGILNFAPALLRVPERVYVEDLDMTMALEKVAYFSRRKPSRRKAARHV